MLGREARQAGMPLPARVPATADPIAGISPLLPRTWYSALRFKRAGAHN
jgi:hypothetical protein